MCSVSQFPTPPDIGLAKTMQDDSVDGGYLANVAYIVEMARTGGTPQCKTVYREFCKAWDAMKGDPGTDKDKEFRALQIALRAIGTNIQMQGG